MKVEGDKMKCQYCGKRTNDMVEHLGKNKNCQKEHAHKLKLQFAEILVEHKKRVKFFKNKNKENRVK